MEKTIIMEKNIRIDFHAHILPGMDHGCRHLETAMKQLEYAATQGIDLIVATSHFYPHEVTVEKFVERREKAYRRVLEEIQKQHRPIPKIRLGAEVLLCQGMQHMEGIERLCVEGTRVLLIEMPFAREWDQKLIASFLEIKNMGYTPVLAHAERYSKDAVQKLTEQGVFVQLNTESFCHFKSRRLSSFYLEKGMVVAFGSDIHGEEITYSHYSKVMKKLGKRADEVQQKTYELMKTYA